LIRCKLLRSGTKRGRFAVGVFSVLGKFAERADATWAITGGVVSAGEVRESDRV